MSPDITEYERQVIEGRRLAARLSEEEVIAEMDTLVLWLRGTVALLVPEPSRVRFAVTGTGQHFVIEIDPGSEANVPRILGRADPTGISAIRALRTLIGKMAARRGLTVGINVQAERR